MSHFSLAIIAEEDANIDDILEPFYEGLEVEPYIEQTKRQFIKNTREYYKSVYESFLEKKEESTEENKEKLKLYEDLINMTDSELYEYQREKYDETDFDREGNLISTYNPESKYDWYDIGGRWDGLLTLKEKDAKGNPITVNQAKIKDINFEPNEKLYEEAIEFWENYVEGKDPSCVGFVLYKPEYYLNKFKTKENYAKATASFTTFAVIAPDGKWYEEGQMLMFGIATDEEEDWEINFKQRFLENIDENLMITIVDCHI